MCFGMCPLENPRTGECRGPFDWSSPEAACQGKAPEEKDVRLAMIDKRFPIAGALYARVLEAQEAQSKNNP
ncbi:hypothetical protein JCM15519_17180 [Fundidesulfovibrio butyratiphilus]